MKKSALTLIFTMLITINALAGNLTDTGITKCYDTAGTEITCPQPGQDYYGQDANYNPPETQMSYTSLGGGTMVKDNVTGLIWEVKTLDNKDDKYTWQDARDVFIAGLNNENFGGYNDWRLPTREELRSLVDYSIPYPGPTINTGYFPNTVNGAYWSSSAYANNTDNAWSVSFSYGYDSHYGKTYSCYVRAVRGGQD